MIAHLILFVVVAVTAYWAWKHRIEIKLSWQMPGLFPYVPFVGIAWRFFIQGKFTNKPLIEIDYIA